MKPILIILISLLAGHTALGQSDIADNNGFTNKAEAENIYKDSLKDGKWIEFLSIGGIEIGDTNRASYYRLIVYKSGNPYGIVRTYFKEGNMYGKLYREVPYKDGNTNGVVKVYYGTGKLKTEAPYVMGKENGVEKGYYISGKLQIEIPYTNGHIIGVKKEYYESGPLYSETPCNEKGENGIKKEYYENGKIRVELPYIDGKIVGVEKLYYRIGSIEEEIFFNNKGVVDSIKKYDEKGNHVAHFPNSYELIPFISGIWQRSFYGQLEISYCYGRGPIMAFSKLGIEGDFDFKHELWAPEFSSEIDWGVICLRGTVADFMQNGENKPYLTPEIGLTLFGAFTLVGGYNVPLVKTGFDEITPFRVSFNCFIPADITINGRDEENGNEIK